MQPQRSFIEAGEQTKEARGGRPCDQTDCTPAAKPTVNRRDECVRKIRARLVLLKRRPSLLVIFYPQLRRAQNLVQCRHNLCPACSHKRSPHPCLFLLFSPVSPVSPPAAVRMIFYLAQLCAAALKNGRAISESGPLRLSRRSCIASPRLSVAPLRFTQVAIDVVPKSHKDWHTDGVAQKEKAGPELRPAPVPTEGGGPWGYKTIY